MLTVLRVGADKCLQISVSAMLTNHQPKRVIKTIWPFIRSKLSLTDSAERTELIAATSSGSSAECTHTLGGIASAITVSFDFLWFSLLKTKAIYF